MNLADIGKQIRETRKTQGMTQQELAQQANISRATLIELERGQLAELGVTKVANILAVLGQQLNIAALSARRPTLDDRIAERRSEALAKINNAKQTS